MTGLSVSSVQRVKRGHQHVAAELARAVMAASEFGARFEVDHVNKYPLFKPRSGSLQSKTKSRAVKLRSGAIIRTTNAAPYAASIDTGARKHEIRAKNVPFLRFKVKGKWVSTKRVKHPGNRPYKFMYRANNATFRVVGRNLGQRMAAIARRF